MGLLKDSEKPAKKLNIKKKLIRVYFESVNQQINLDMECYNVDKFSILEQKLFLKYPALKGRNIIYLVGGNSIMDKSLALEELQIKDESHILIEFI